MRFVKKKSHGPPAYSLGLLDKRNRRHDQNLPGNMRANEFKSKIEARFGV